VKEALQSLGLQSTIFDGEIAALDDKGRTSFQLLQAREMGDQRPASSLLHLRLAAGQRRRPALTTSGGTAGTASKATTQIRKGILRFSEGLDGDGKMLLEEARKLELEGLIGKRLGSVYESGRRTGAWIKLKTHHEQEFVIGGYSDPPGPASMLERFWLESTRRRSCCTAAKLEQDSAIRC
jgi:bifunctional non-homologous end joining protein LigD